MVGRPAGVRAATLATELRSFDTPEPVYLARLAIAADVGAELAATEPVDAALVVG